MARNKFSSKKDTLGKPQRRKGEKNRNKFSKGKKTSPGFWNAEYNTQNNTKAVDAPHLALSNNPSTDMIKFLRWFETEYKEDYLHIGSTVADLGCGNGRNLIYLAQTFGIVGFGCDISKEAISVAKRLSSEITIRDERGRSLGQREALPLDYAIQSITNPIPLPNESQNLVLDMMTSHFLNQEQRTKFINEVLRILKPDGWLYFKTFLLDEDKHAERLIKEFPALEKNSYIHPQIGVAEHVFTEEEIRGMLEEHFIIYHVRKSQQHIQNGKAARRRSISIYAQKK